MSDNSLPGDPYEDCDGCQRLLWERRQFEYSYGVDGAKLKEALREALEIAESLDESDASNATLHDPSVAIRIAELRKVLDAT